MAAFPSFSPSSLDFSHYAVVVLPPSSFRRFLSRPTTLFCCCVSIACPAISRVILSLIAFVVLLLTHIVARFAAPPVLFLFFARPAPVLLGSVTGPLSGVPSSPSLYPAFFSLFWFSFALSVLYLFMSQVSLVALADA